MNVNNYNYGKSSFVKAFLVFARDWVVKYGGM
jgi:hypothetical protein